MNAIMLALSLAVGQTADIRLSDGSLVRLGLVTDRIEVKTAYGTLIVPANEIRRIDFGLHLHEGVRLKLESAAKNLASPSFRERDEAAKALQAMGEQATPTLERLVRGQDMEASTRAANIIRVLSENGVTGRREDDVIITRSFTVIGRVQTPKVMARSAVLGDMALSLPDMRTMHVMDKGEHEFTVASERFGDAWFETGVRVDGFVRLRIDADGQVDLWPMGPGQYMVSPKGFTTTGKGGNFMAGALVGRIGDTGRAFFIGDRHDAQVSDEGTLFLQIVPSPWNNVSSGSYKVRVRTETRQ